MPHRGTGETCLLTMSDSPVKSGWKESNHRRNRSLHHRYDIGFGGELARSQTLLAEAMRSALSRQLLIVTK
jgi:hypothetical protein